MKLRNYQITAISNIYSAMSSGKRSVVLVAPTGSGKTATASKVILDAAVTRRRSVLVMAHTGELLDQLSSSLSAWGVEHGIIRDGEADFPGRPVQVASIQSLDSSVALPHLGARDLIVADECHRADADKIILRYPDPFLLGLTATPYRMANGKVVPVPNYQHMVVAAVPRRLESWCYIVPLRIFCPPMADNFIGDDESGLSKRERVMGSSDIIGDVVETWKSRGPRATIGYCCTIAHSKAQAKAFCAAGIDARHISGEDRLEKRRDVLADFKAGKFPVLLNANLLIEGLDVPFVSRILKLRPTMSPAVDLQQTGRGVRPFPDKKDCEIFDHAGNFFTHGHPYDERLVSLDTQPGIGRQVEDDSGVGIWRCPECFCCVAGFGGGDCPYCGVAAKHKTRRLKMCAGELVEYDEELIRRAKEEKENEAAQKALNHQRIRGLYSLAYRAGYQEKRRNAFVFSELAKFKADTQKTGKTWENFFEEARLRTQKQSTSSSTHSNPLLDDKSS